MLLHLFFIPYKKNMLYGKNCWKKWKTQWNCWTFYRRKKIWNSSPFSVYPSRYLRYKVRQQQQEEQDQEQEQQEPREQQQQKRQQRQQQQQQQKQKQRQR